MKTKIQIKQLISRSDAWDGKLYARWLKFLARNRRGGEVPFIRFSRRRWILHGGRQLWIEPRNGEKISFYIECPVSLCRARQVSIVCFIKNRDIRRNFRSPFGEEEFGNGNYPTEFLSFNTLLMSWNALWIIVASATDTGHDSQRLKFRE